MMKTMRPKRHANALRTALAGALALAFCAALSAQPGGHERGRGGERLARYLELDESQRAEWQAIREDGREEAKAIFDELRANRESLRALLEAGGADPAEVGQIVLDGHALEQSMRVFREGVDEKLAAVLTSEQVDKWEAYKAARETRGPRGHRRGPRRGHFGR